MGRRRRRTNQHHLRPRCRFEKGENMDKGNIVILDEKFHQNWHSCFGHLTPSEAVEFIQIVMTSGTTWDSKRLHRLRMFLAERGE